MLKNTAVRLIAFVVAFALVVLIVPGVERNGNWSIVISALVYMVINATAGRILNFSPGSRRPSIPTSATGGARPRASSELSRR